jgi:hypothetical protein
MIDPPIHLLLFVTVVLVIVVLHRFFVTTDDREALRGIPGRLAKYLLWCGVVAAAMIVAEHTVASVH